jgi:hypothetical protein
MSKEIVIGIHKVWEAAFSDIEPVTNKQIAGRIKYITLRHVKTGESIGKGYIIEGHAPIRDTVVRILLNKEVRWADVYDNIRNTLDILYPKIAYEFEVFSLSAMSLLAVK